MSRLRPLISVRIPAAHNESMAFDAVGRVAPQRQPRRFHGLGAAEHVAADVLMVALQLELDGQANWKCGSRSPGRDVRQLYQQPYRNEPTGKIIVAKFKTRARAIDLLGRQQIAGIPTAINELFKNAHDAYADHVDVDYFRKQKLFVLRDDGLGMTKDDFLDRWLVLGTESKYDNKRIKPPPIDPSKTPRPVMGEKGIGRLAIAAIGKQTLILSRASRKNKLQNAVAALINWGIFEIPGLDLDEVVIPLREFTKGLIPDELDIESMKKELIDSIANLNEKKLLIGNEAKDLIAEIRSFKVDPISLCKKLSGNLSLISSSGTHFYISPANESLNYDIDGNPNDKGKVSKLEKFLTGFTNTMTPNHPKPNIEASFRDYRAADDIYEVT